MEATDSCIVLYNSHVCSNTKKLCFLPCQGVEAMQTKVFQYDPVDAGLSVPIINILLCGGVGAGKSSIVSTVDSICKGRISRVAQHGQGTSSLTSMLRKYAFKQPNSSDPVKWQLWDTMGWGVDDYKRGELGFILDGNLPNKCELSKPISTRTEGFKTNPHLRDRVHCVILVVPCNAATDEAYMTRLNEMRQFARERGEYQGLSLHGHLCCCNLTICCCWSIVPPERCLACCSQRHCCT